MINFLSIITSSLKSLVSNIDVPKPSLYLEYKSKNIDNMILTDGNYDFEAENISYTSPKKSYFPSQNES